MSVDTVSPATSITEAYKSKSDGYFSGARFDFIEQLPRDSNARILEIGSGSGKTGAIALKTGRAGHYVGVELMDDAANLSRKVLSDVIVGDVEQLEFEWQPASFDALILSEVLEHLREPTVTLKRLARFVRPGGTVLASSPNISHWRVLHELMMGRFPKADQGVFDRTHLRWFTPTTFAEMFEEAGYQVVQVSPVTPFSDRTRLISRLTFGRFDHLFMTQISLKAIRNQN